MYMQYVPLGYVLDGVPSPEGEWKISAAGALQISYVGDPRLGPSPRHHYQPQGTIPLPHLHMYLYMASCKLILFSKPMRLREGAIFF